MMKIHALVIAPYKGLIELTSSLKEELQDFRISMLQGDLSEVLPMVTQIEEGKYDVIISRGGTARLLRQHVSIPVIDIQVSGYDIMRIITLVKDTQSKVEMIGFPNIIDGFIAVSRIMDIQIQHTVIEHENEAGRALVKAKETGVSMVLGDTITVRMAQELGLEGVLITSGKESVLEAFAQARYMQTIVKRYQQKCSLYEQLLNNLDTGFAVFDENNMFQYGNNTFFSQWGISPEHSKGELREQNPNITRLLDCLKQGVVFDEVITICEPLQPFVLSAGPSTTESGPGFYMKTNSRPSMDSELKVSFSMGDMLSYPLLLSRDNAANTSSEGIGKEHGDFPIALYGEKGTGKRLWSLTRIQSDQPVRNKLFIEIELLKSGKRSVEGLQNILMQVDESIVLYLNGIENIELVHQKSLAAWIMASQAQVILSFAQNPAVLLGEGSLEPALYEIIKDKALFFPPLRERSEDLETLIRSFIAKSNETTGKQIVGMRTSVLNALLQQPWTGNLIELKETIDWLVQISDGDFIEEEALHLLAAQKIKPVVNGTDTQENSNKINLNQTLEEIERDIILVIMEEEEMNQSKAAKRLGINRSTLWRKLKQTES
ncbi:MULTISPECIES: PrpR N-terminal domain-containing protein [unclassified Paenibacillus]|uniref:PrpR N-terminal domain-containing protein n=1 Tax=unclassified Paenibacillus TaxID=185978 RepID=UPI00362F072A